MAVLGHRGLRGRLRENTLEAFRTAAAEGADGVELDVRRTRDGVLIIHHDAAVDGTAIIDVDHAEALGRWPWMPTFEDALDACDGLLVNVEVKNDPRDPDFDPDGRVARAVADLIAHRGLRENTLVSSFHAPTAAQLRELDPQLRTGLLVAPAAKPHVALADAVAAGHQAVHPWIGAMTEAVAGELTEAAHAAGLWVVVWTVNDVPDLRRCASAGVDAVIVDDPAAALTALAA